MTVARSVSTAVATDRSPITGWTRQHWEESADRLLGQAQRGLHRNERGPMAGFGRWPASADHLAGFARSFVLASYRMAHPERPPDLDLADHYGSGLLDRLRGARRRTWPAPNSSQAAVYEAAHLATALFESRVQVWDHIDDADRQVVVAWLTAAHRAETYDNNWALAPLVVAGFLRSVGAEWDQAIVDESLRRAETWYRGDGCYTDGPEPRFDHYWAWGVHHFLAQWERMSPSPDAERRRRLRIFLAHYGTAIDDRGAPLHVGRSLSYRTAGVGLFWAGAMLDATPYDPGQTRCLASSVLGHFVDRGAFAHRTPTQGWYRRFDPMADGYSSPSAPLLCGLGFSGLLLAPDHPVWTETETQWRSVADGHQLGSSGFALSHHDGVSQLHNHQLTDSDAGREPHPLYTRLGYTSATGPEWPRRGNRLSDNDLTVHDGRRRHHRGPCTQAGHGWGRWSWSSGSRRGHVVVAQVNAAGVRIRAHRVVAPSGVGVSETGFAVAGETRPVVSVGRDWILCVSDDVQVLTASLLGFESVELVRQNGTNAFGRYSALGRLRSARPMADRVVVSLHLVARRSIDPALVLDDTTVTLEGADRVHVRYGDHRFELDLPDPTGSIQS